MLGAVLRKIIDLIDGQRHAAAPAPEVILEMKRVGNDLLRMDIASVDQLLADRWLAGSGSEDQDALCHLTFPLFLAQPGFEGKEAVAARAAAAGGFTPDVGMVDTGEGSWRVFRVAPEVENLAVGDCVREVDGMAPGQAKDWAGAFYSKVQLTVVPAAGGPRRTVELRRTRLEKTAPLETDAERFRKYLLEKFNATPAQYSRSDLLNHFIRFCLSLFVEP
jgi:hypothetical protein